MITALLVFALTTRSAIAPGFLPGLTLVVLTAGRKPAAKLEVALVQYAIATGGIPGCAPEGVDHVRHDGGRLPFTGGNTGVQMRRA